MNYGGKDHCDVSQYISNSFASINLPQEDTRNERKQNERKVTTLLTTLLTENQIESQINIFNKISNFSKLVRIIAYCKRIFLKTKPKKYYISAAEYKHSLISTLKMVQNESFCNEIKCLNSEKMIDKYGQLFTLNAMICHDGLLRLSSRLRRPMGGWSEKYQISFKTNNQ